jgi:hypothetical protein
MAIVNYVKQTPDKVSVDYYDFELGTELVFVDAPSGKKITAAAVLSGNGSLDIPMDNLPSGDYYLLARNAGKWAAQTVMFYRK